MHSHNIWRARRSGPHRLAFSNYMATGTMGVKSGLLNAAEVACDQFCIHGHQWGGNFTQTVPME